MGDATRYLNTDLDLVSRQDLGPLVGVLESRGMSVLHLGAEQDGLWRARLETGEQYEEPERNIVAILALIESLTEAQRAAWASLERREISIGYDCGTAPHSLDQRLSERTLSRLAAAGLSLQITLYALESSGEGSALQTLDNLRVAHTPATSSIREVVPGSRLGQQLVFLVEIDRLKGVLRQTTLCDGSRYENSAEHSWHLAIMAGILSEYAPPDVDWTRLIRMLLVHDIVEIDAGDAFAYDATANVGRVEREQIAAARIFSLLPNEQATELRDLWEEFETRMTIEAKVAAAFDRLQPLLNNYSARGGSWRAHGVTRSQVLRRMDPIRESLPAIWPAVLQIISVSCEAGHIRDDT